MSDSPKDKKSDEKSAPLYMRYFKHSYRELTPVFLALPYAATDI